MRSRVSSCVKLCLRLRCLLACFGLVTYVGSGRVGQTSDAIFALGGIADVVRSKIVSFCHVMTPPWWFSFALCHGSRVWFRR